MYSHLAQLVVCNVPLVSLLDTDDKHIDDIETGDIVNATLVEIGVKGCGRACDVSLQPPSLILPSVCVIGQVYLIFYHHVLVLF